MYDNSKITGPSVQDYVTSLLKTMELPVNYYKNGNSNTDILSMKKIWMFVLSSPKDQYTHFKTLYYEHKNSILIAFVVIWLEYYSCVHIIMSQNVCICLLEMTIQTFVSYSWVIYLYSSFRSCDSSLIIPFLVRM